MLGGRDRRLGLARKIGMSASGNGSSCFVVNTASEVVRLEACAG